MTYVPPASVLMGVPYGTASKFGMPHVGASYARDNVDTNALDEGAVCAVCGMRATNSHHEPPRGMGGRHRQFTLHSPWGRFVLKPALIALCGSGTTGCHGNRHEGLWRAEWRWDSDEDAEAWWSGRLLSHGYEPHSPKLYDHGSWAIVGRDGRPIMAIDAQGRHGL